MIPVTDQHEFRQLTSAADDIFAYKESIPDIGVALGFDRGNVSDDGDSAYAVFSCTSLSGWGRDTVTISAKKQPGGKWSVTHSIETK